MYFIVLIKSMTRQLQQTGVEVGERKKRNSKAYLNFIVPIKLTTTRGGKEKRKEKG